MVSNCIAFDVSCTLSTSKDHVLSKEGRRAEMDSEEERLASNDMVRPNVFGLFDRDDDEEEEEE